MKPGYLTKSSFKIGRECPTKIYYKIHDYPNDLEEDEYLELLADGGYMIGKMAQLLFPDGHLIDAGRSRYAIEETEKLLEQDRLILFEAAIAINNKLVRIDVLIKNGNHFQLIEVKSKSFDRLEYQEAERKGKNYFRGKDWRPYIEDVAYQKFVLQEKFPGATIECFLLMPDKSKINPIEGLISWFEIDRKVFEKYTFIKVNFKGDPEELRKNHILEQINIDREVQSVLSNPDFLPAVESFIQSISTDTRIITPVSTHCRDCEYRIRDDRSPVGFRECWDERAEPQPHILDLGQLGNFNKNEEINRLISMGKASLYDVPSFLVEGKYRNRPFYQLTEKEEFVKLEFFEELKSIRYPLWFIDFETSQMAVPYHAGMRPYGKVIFQWSCHSIAREKSVPEHHEWINVIDSYPNIEFARRLKECIGDAGTIFTWSKYENTQLKDIYNTMAQLYPDDDELLVWLKRLLTGIEEGNNRFIDMNDWAKKYYFHPSMGARTSIKVTLPAVLKATHSEQIKDYLRMEGLLKEEDGSIVDPYKLLPPIEIADQSESVQEGTGVMRAYQDMLYGIHKDDPAIRDKYKNALLKYCKLDTLAMVIIWEHWVHGGIKVK